MKDKYNIIPTKIARSRKIQRKQFEPEEIWIEVELNITDSKATQEAIQRATELATNYLDQEEELLRKRYPSINETINQPVVKSTSISSTPVAQYALEITPEGKKLGLQIKHSNDPKFKNFIHLWHGSGKQETYVGYLLKSTGDFKFKAENQDKLTKYKISEKMHFRIIKEST